jgi:hypothetical protein
MMGFAKERALLLYPSYEAHNLFLTDIDEVIAMMFPRRKFLHLAAGAVTLPATALLMHSAMSPSVSLAADCDALNCGAGRAMPFRQGPYFNHSMPAGFEVVTEDNHSLVLQSRDKSADIMVSGAAGLKEQTSPELFAYQWMSTAMHLVNVRLLGVVYVNPMSAYETAGILDVSYTGPNGPMRGLAISNIANYHKGNVYIATDGMIAIVGSKERLWAAYGDWLPLVGLQALHNGPDPFRDATTPVPRDTDVHNPEAVAHREWAMKTWDEYSDYRAKLLAGRGGDPAAATRLIYDNPYGGPPVEQFAGPAAIWINPDGQQIPTDNPAFDPRTATDPDWQRLIPKQR